MEDPSATEQHGRGQQMPLYVRLKRHRDEAPPPFLCVLRPQKRQQLAHGEPERPGLLERALIFKHVDAAPPPVTPLAPQGDLSFQQHSVDVAQPHVPRKIQHLGPVDNAEKRSFGETACVAYKEPVLDEEEFSAAEERATFWSAFNAPLRPGVFGAYAGTEVAAPSRLGYQDAVEEAVKSLRRFRVDGHQLRGTLGNHAQPRSVLLHSGNTAQVLDVCQDGGANATTDAADAQQESGEFEYDLYEIECDSGENYPWWQRDGGFDTHKRRLLELLQQDRSAVALVEVEDVDKETGVVIRGNGSMQVFLEEFGDIDDNDSGRRLKRAVTVAVNGGCTQTFQ